MSSTAIELLQDGELFTRVFTTPLVDAVRTEMQVHTKTMNDAVAGMQATVASFNGRLVKLERDQRKALVGWSLYASAAAGVFAYAWTWLRSHFRVSL